MKFRIIAATCAALAFGMVGPASAAQVFNGAIPNIPGKSLLAVEVDYAPGAASPSHTHAKSAFIYAYVIRGACFRAAAAIAASEDQIAARVQFGDAVRVLIDGLATSPNARSAL